MNKETEDRIALIVGLILLVLIACIICYMTGYRAAKGAETTKPVVNPSTLTRPTCQDWSDMGLAVKASEERKAREAEVVQEIPVFINDEQPEIVNTPQPGQWQGSPGVEQWRELVASYSWCGWETDRMLRIMEHESHGDPNAYNPSGPYVGLFQHLNQNGEYDDDPWYEPWWNVALAAEKFLTSGYAPWAGTDW